MGANLSYTRVDLSGRVAIVTGANSGTGYETTKALARMGAKVIMACRSQSRAEQAMDRMKSELPDSQLDLQIMILNLASLRSTVEFAEEFRSEHDKLNILCCNAGYIGDNFEVTEDRLEAVFQSNYLSHLLLVTQLVPLMKTSGPDARIVSVSSSGHQVFGKMMLPETNVRAAYSQTVTYGASKLYQILMTGWLHQRLRGTNISATSLHPGAVHTNFNAGGWIGLGIQLGYYLGISRSPEQGAASSIYACVNPELAGQENLYITDCHPATASSTARDVNNQDMLLDYSLYLLKDYITEEGAEALDIHLSALPTPPPEWLAAPTAE
ncbi:WW domain-containing oxidoreductase-like [Sycon ciliatum]|uniref:WW domain-containing oxidoreductase-like n=1 Tax=Sycon ciliatum TaxID=27933 RepID=UPI0031F6B317